MTRRGVLLTLLAILAAGCVQREITAPYAHETYSEEDIREILMTGVMKDRLDAIDELEALPVARRLGLLEDLLPSADEKTRLLAIDALGRMPGNPRAQILLIEMAENDVDAIVRFKAGRRLRAIEATSRGG